MTTPNDESPDVGRSASKSNGELERIIDDLVLVLNAYEGKSAHISCQGQGMNGYSALANFVSIANRARDLRSNVKVTGAPPTDANKGDGA